MWIGSKLTFMPGPARTAVSLMISACTCALCRLCVTVRARHRRAAAMEMPALPCCTPTPLPGLHPSRRIDPRERYNSSSCRSAALLSCGRTMRSDCSTRRPQSRNARAPRTRACTRACTHRPAKASARARKRQTRDGETPTDRAPGPAAPTYNRRRALPRSPWRLARAAGSGMRVRSSIAPPTHRPRTCRTLRGTRRHLRRWRQRI